MCCQERIPKGQLSQKLPAIRMSTGASCAWSYGDQSATGRWSLWRWSKSMTFEQTVADLRQCLDKGAHGPIALDICGVSSNPRGRIRPILLSTAKEKAIRNVPWVVAEYNAYISASLRLCGVSTRIYQLRWLPVKVTSLTVPWLRSGPAVVQGLERVEEV